MSSNCSEELLCTLYQIEFCPRQHCIAVEPRTVVLYTETVVCNTMYVVVIKDLFIRRTIVHNAPNWISTTELEGRVCCPYRGPECLRVTQTSNFAHRLELEW